MNISQAKQLPLSDILERLGHLPTHRRGEELWYRSPFRNEAEPSFKINDNNYWYDFATGSHGDVIDLIRELHGQCSVKDALAELRSLLGELMVPIRDDKPSPIPKRSKSKAEITSVGPVQSRALLSYLQTRGISESIGRELLSEIRYRRGGKDYFALAFENDAGGFEIRTQMFKGSLENKSISTCNPGGNQLAVFEGFTDYLTAIDRGLIAKDDSAIVMNSAALKDATVEQLVTLAPKVVTLWLDNDPTGKQTINELTQKITERLSGVSIVDKSSIYADHDDLNAFHASEQAAKQR